jgi:hypothetical protein
MSDGLLLNLPCQYATFVWQLVVRQGFEMLPTAARWINPVVIFRFHPHNQTFSRFRSFPKTGLAAIRRFRKKPDGRQTTQVWTLLKVASSDRKIAEGDDYGQAA